MSMNQRSENIPSFERNYIPFVFGLRKFQLLYLLKEKLMLVIDHTAPIYEIKENKIHVIFINRWSYLPNIS